MRTSSIRIQVIANGAGISYSKAERLIKEAAGEIAYGEEYLDDWHKGRGRGMRDALVLQGADAAVVDKLLADLKRIIEELEAGHK